jgi:autotransporter passenger strand-loop-strand repeat protein
MGSTISSGVTSTITAEVSGLSVLAGGSLVVSGGGIALGAAVLSGGNMTVLSGGIESASLIEQGGTETVLAGGVARGTVVEIDGTLGVASGGIAITPVVSSDIYLGAGSVVVSSGGVLSGGGNFVTLAAGGSLAPGGGVLQSLTVAAGATADIGGGLAVYTGVVAAGGSMVVGPGGSFYGQIQSGGFVLIESGGSGTNVAAAAGGTVEIGAGGVDLFYGSAVQSVGGAELSVLSGGTVEVTDRFQLGGERVASGGLVLVSGYGSLGPLSLSGGTVSAGQNGVVVAATADPGAMIVIGSGGSAISDGVSGGTLILQTGAVISGGLAFDQYGYGGDIIISGTALPTVPVSGFGRDDTIDLPNIPFDPLGTIAAGASAVTFVENGFDYTLPIVSAGLIGQTLLMAGDATGGTMIEVPCFAAGTRIATPAGEVPVQALRPGDAVLTLGGAAWRAGRVRWVGTVAIDLGRHPRPDKAAPIRIAAGAFAAGVPARDLLVSPDHALLIDGMLIQAQALANGATIAQEFPRHIVYWHVELDAHAILSAEGLPAESYRDTGNRGQFAGEAGARTLHPDLAGGAAPLALAGPAVAAAQARLGLRALSLGHRLTGRPALVVAGDSPLPRCGVLRWRVPAGTRALRLLSRGFVPAWFGEDDRRRLGIAVRAVRLDGQPPPPAAFGRGWHAPEGGWRWTDGAAGLHLPPLPRAATLAVELTRRGGRYWLAPVPSGAVRAA